MHNEYIGVIGHMGDLGETTTELIMDTHTNIARYDSVTGVNIKQLGSVMAARYVHCCAPLSVLDQVRHINPDCTLILHDSLMANSLKAMQDIKARAETLGQVAIVHYLKNNKRTVVVANESDDISNVRGHLSKIGLKPINMDTLEHDKLMATSQGIAATLMNLIPTLEVLNGMNLLTPSAYRLLRTLIENQYNMTDESVISITSNPDINNVLDGLKPSKSKGRSKHVS